MYHALGHLVMSKNVSWGTKSHLIKNRGPRHIGASKNNWELGSDLKLVSQEMEEKRLLTDFRVRINKTL